MHPSRITLFRAACVLSGLAVALGAFGAHGLKERLTPDMLAIFEVGVRYQFYHALALLALALGPDRLWRGPWAARASWAWIAGVAVFSGSLYILSISGIRWLGAITPIGGVAFILGWVFALGASRELVADDAGQS